MSNNPNYDLTNQEISGTFQNVLQTDGFGNFFNGLGDVVIIRGGTDIPVNRYFIQAPPAPAAVNAGDRWYDTSSGAEFVWIIDSDSSQWVAPIGIIDTNNYVPNDEQTVVNGTLSGTATFSQPEKRSSYKKILIYCNGLNGEASYTFPVPFSYLPAIIDTSSLNTNRIITLTKTTVTVSCDIESGFIIIEGF